VLCSDASALNLITVDGGGIWTGTGITDPNLGTFDPATAGSGTHTIDYVIAGSCGDSDQIDVIVQDRPDASVDPAGPFCRYELPYQMTATTPGGQWTANCGTCISITGEFDPVAAGAGTWLIYYSVGGVCSEASNTAIAVSECLGLEDEVENFISIFPNPSEGMININFENQFQGSLQIHDMSGRILLNSIIDSDKVKIDVKNHLSMGSYILTVLDTDLKAVRTEKLIIR
ncbi:MAG: hypothetical protein ACI857_000342, partial [Arenicella sp.]